MSTSETIHIEKAVSKYARILSEIAAITFIESHGSSAKQEDIDHFIAEKYSEDAFTAELLNTKNNYHLIWYNDCLAGFSNIIYNFPPLNNKTKDIAKLERIYLLKEFYCLKLGHRLFDFNLNVAKQHDQKGIWLFVWKENKRAINFYTKNGFTITGTFDYKISETHSNPNHIMFLQL